MHLESVRGLYKNLPSTRFHVLLRYKQLLWRLYVVRSMFSYNKTLAPGGTALGQNAKSYTTGAVRSHVVSMVSSWPIITHT